MELWRTCLVNTQINCLSSRMSSRIPSTLLQQWWHQSHQTDGSLTQYWTSECFRITWKAIFINNILDRRVSFNQRLNNSGWLHENTNSISLAATAAKNIKHRVTTKWQCYKKRKGKTIRVRYGKFTSNDSSTLPWSPSSSCWTYTLGSSALSQQPSSTQLKSMTINPSHLSTNRG